MTNFQTTNIIVISKITTQINLEIEYCNLFGIWKLEFGN